MVSDKSRFPSVFFPVLFLLVLSRLPAQTHCFVNVQVTDLQSGAPIQGATFTLDFNETLVSTDSTGKIRMPVTCSEHSLNFKRIGYKPWWLRVTVLGDTIVPVQMENIATQIEEVVITSQNAVRTLETPALGVSMLSLRAMQKIAPAAGEVDVLKSLQTLPGISAVGEGANGINIRGGWVDQNLILLDNMPVFNPTHLLGLFSLFPTDAIRELQIYKGSIPARYGGRTGGVLDVKMSDPNTEKFKLRGGAGLISNRLHAEIPIVKGKLAWMFSGRFSFNEYLIKFYNNVLIDPIADKKIPDNHPAFFDLANKILWRPTDRDVVTLANYISYDSYKVDSLFSISGIVPKQATMRYGHNNLALRWNHSISDQLNFNLLAVRSDYNTHTGASDLKASFNYDTRILNHIGKAELTYAPSERQRINSGLILTRYDLHPADLAPLEGSSVSSAHLPSEQALEAAFFASDEYELSKNLLAEIGFRYVQYWNLGPSSIPVYATDVPKSLSSITDTIQIRRNAAESVYGRFEPRLALRYKINDLSSVKLGYNRMNQFLQMVANNTTPLPNVRWKMSNRYVKPAQSDLFSAGYFHDTKTRMWEWSVEGYFRQQRDIFDYLNGADLNINPAVETQLLKGIAQSYGAELFINKKKGVVTGWLSYTYARSLEKISGDFPALQALNGNQWFRTNVDKPHTLNLLINIQTEKHNSVSFTFVYSTGRPYTAPVSFFKNGFDYIPVYTDRNNGRISDYHRLDFAWTIINPSMKERRWEGSWVVTLYNVYGRKNAFSYFFNPDFSSFKPFEVSVFPLPIFSLTYNFKFE
jgi:hypothetical protein